jgi:outer membrane immunogenic protein
MRRDLLAATALTTTLAMLAGGAQAQEYDWTGFYAGFGLGLAAGGEATFDYPSPGFYDNFPETLPLSGFGGGSLSAGYNAQSGQFVFGAEADKTFALTLQNSFAEVDNTDVPTDESLDVRQTMNLFTFRGRGGVAFDRLLLYGTAGLAAANSTLEANAAFDTGTTKGSTTGSTTDILFGFVAGGGVEYALKDEARLEIEALFFDLTDQSVTTDPGILESFEATSTSRGVIVRTGINIPFN